MSIPVQLARFLGSGMTSQRARDRLVSRLRQLGIQNPAVLDVLRFTPRHVFVDEALSSYAYDNTALPIGYGQTISQPYIVARMTEILLSGGPLQRVLEVGTGCGYQTAVLAQLVGQIDSVERIAPLLAAAQARIQGLGLNNVRFHHSDGSWGWPAQAPYQGILVAAAPEEVPSVLLEQLDLNASLIIPVGPQEGVQVLQQITRTRSGYRRCDLEPVSFVPMRAGMTP